MKSNLMDFKCSIPCASIFRVIGSQSSSCMQLENLVSKGIAEAKRNIQAQRRERALLYLRKNKVYDHSLKNIDDYLLNVEQAGFQSAAQAL